MEHSDLSRQEQRALAWRYERNDVELEASNAELDAFAHTVAHDLKTPLTILIGFSDLLGQRVPRWSPEQVSEATDRISRAGRKMTDIIHELLLLASVRKIEEITMALLDMAAIVAEVQARLAGMFAEYEGTLTLPETWPVAIGYAPWIEEVWANYISNALKYGGTPPQVVLGAERVQIEGAAQVRFWVKDNGPGLTEAEQAQLFTQFTRLHTARTAGHGLGLSIVQRIVAKLGGAVGVASAPGAGSRFYFTLPAA